MKTENSIENELSMDIKRIMSLDNNKDSYTNFQEIIKDLHPKCCKVKFGWCSGEEISFTCHFEKNGTGDPFDEFIKGIKDKAEVYGFINGLNPTIFHFNSKFILDENENLVINFKLMRNE